MVDGVTGPRSSVWVRRVDVDREGEAFRRLGFSALPTTLLIDSKGEPLEARVGAIPGPELASWLESHGL